MEILSKSQAGDPLDSGYSPGEMVDKGCGEYIRFEKAGGTHAEEGEETGEESGPGGGA
jgi:hypothetical protein